MNAQSPKRMAWLDCLRLMAGVSMVGLHASSDPSGQPFPDYAAIDRIGPVLFRAVVYVARTELFLIISLFLLAMSLDRRPRGYADTIREQAQRLLLPFAFWVVFFAFFRLIKASYFGYENAIWEQLLDPADWLGYFVLGNVQYHMHFLPTLFALVLMFPLYRIAVDKPLFGFVILMCLFAKREVDIWLWQALNDMMGFEYLVRFVKVVTYAGYGIVAAGFYGMVKRGLPDVAWRDFGWLALFIGILMFSIKLVYSHKVIVTGHWQYNYDPAYWADFLMPVILFAVCLSFASADWPKWISRLAPYSFGIYLAHPALLDLIEIALWGLSLHPMVFVSAKVTLALVFTSLLVWALSRIPFLAWTVGLGPFPKFTKYQHSSAS